MKTFLILVYLSMSQTPNLANKEVLLYRVVIPVPSVEECHAQLRQFEFNPHPVHGKIFLGGYCERR